MGTITGSGANGWQLRLDYEVTGQSAASNTSTVRLTLSVYDGTGYSRNETPQEAYYILQGEKVWSPYYYSATGWYTLGSRSITVQHDEDGSASAYLSGEWCCGFESQYTPYSLTAAGYAALPTIPRASEVTAPGGVLGQEVLITVSRRSSAFTHSLYASHGTGWQLLAQGVETGLSWTPDMEYARARTDGNMLEVGLRCVTYNGDSYVGTRECSVQLMIPEDERTRPGIQAGWATVSHDNSGTRAEGIDAYIQGYSRAKVTFDPEKITCRYGAQIQRYEVQWLGQTAAQPPYRTDVLTGTKVTVRCVVRDSRGMTASQDMEVTLQEYAPPCLTGAALWRAAESGEKADTGECIAGRAGVRWSPVGGKNQCTLRGYWKSAGGSYGSGVEMESGATALVSGGAKILTSASYWAKLVATDTLGNMASYEALIPTETVAFHLREGGKGAAFGKMAEEDGLLEVAADWDVKIRGKRLADLMYPVGSIYLSANAASPQTLFGGEWKRLEGRFLIGAGSEYAAGSTGGEARHTLTVDEIPNHEHWVRQRGNTSRAYTQDCYAPGGSEDPYSSIIRADMSGDYAKPSVSWGGQLVAGEVISDDHNQPHNNLPPYLAVYMWQRTA